MNEARHGEGSLQYRKLNYSHLDVAAVKYATTYGPATAAAASGSFSGSGSDSSGSSSSGGSHCGSHSGSSSGSSVSMSASATWALVMDRAVGNCLEQQPAFLASTWLHALLVPGDGPAQAAWLASVYVASRAAYPLLFWCGHPWLQLSTCPGYWVIWYQLYRVVVATAAARL